MNTDQAISTPRLIIRAVKPEDVTDDYVSGLNDPNVNRFLEVRLKRHSLDDVKKYVSHNLSSPNSVLLGLFTKENSRLIGTIRLHEITPYYCTAYLGICIFAKSFHGQGLGVEALEHAVKYAFEKLGLFAILAPVYSENDRSVKLFQKAQFYVETEIKGRLRYDDRFVDGFIFCKKNPAFDMSKLKERQSRSDYDYVK